MLKNKTKWCCQILLTGNNWNQIEGEGRFDIDAYRVPTKKKKREDSTVPGYKYINVGPNMQKEDKLHVSSLNK